MNKAIDSDVPYPVTREANRNAEARENRSTSPSAWERELVEQAKHGDKDAFGQLVEQYQRRVYALAFGILRQREDAWDVAQETFVKAFRHLHRYEGTAAFYTWLYRIAYNLSIDTLREKARRETPEAATGGEPVAQATRIDGCGVVAAPDETAARRELSDVLQRAMSQLSDKHRAIIVLREIEGLSYEEMADVLGISKGTVMSRLFHARQNLQTLLQPYVAEGDDVPGTFQLTLAHAASR